MSRLQVWGSSFVVGIGLAFALPANAAQLHITSTPGGKILEFQGTILGISLEHDSEKDPGFGLLKVTAERGSCWLRLPAGELAATAKLLLDDAGTNHWVLHCLGQVRDSGNKYLQYVLTSN